MLPIKESKQRKNRKNRKDNRGKKDVKSKVESICDKKDDDSKAIEIINDGDFKVTDHDSNSVSSTTLETTSLASFSSFKSENQNSYKTNTSKYLDDRNDILLSLSNDFLSYGEKLYRAKRKILSWIENIFYNFVDNMKHPNGFIIPKNCVHFINRRNEIHIKEQFRYVNEVCEYIGISYYDIVELRCQIGVAGCIILSKDKKKILLVRSKQHNGWGFPKGSIELDEKEFQAATRETYEEANVLVKDIADTSSRKILFKKGRKIFSYFVIFEEEYKIEGKLGKVEQNIEIDEIEWFPIPEYDDLPKLEKYAKYGNSFDIEHMKSVLNKLIIFLLNC